jgi:hypothetical protein
MFIRQKIAMLSDEESRSLSNRCLNRYSGQGGPLDVVFRAIFLDQIFFDIFEQGSS